MRYDQSSMNREDRLFRAIEEIQGLVESGQEVNVADLASKHELDETELMRCQLVLDMFGVELGADQSVMGERDDPRTELPEDYEIVDELGRGGMGVVYRARQKSLDRDVAVKILRPDDRVLVESLGRFRKEARSLAKLRHRHIVSIHEVGEVGRFVYYTMDLVEGRTLADVISGRPLTTARSVKILQQITSAIAYAHGQGVVHRDLKPANILIDENGDACVVDFGLARDSALTDATMTATGQLLGTPAYMSPEQARGDRRVIGETSDIHALGVILYECTVGAPPFAADDLVELIQAVANEDPVPPRRKRPQLSRDLELICLKAMAKRPEDRYPTALALGEDLERFSEGRTVRAKPPTALDVTRRFVMRHALPISVAVATLVVAVLIHWFFVRPQLWQQGQIALAERWRLEGDYAAAVGAYSEALDAVRRDDAIHERYTEALLLRAEELHRLGDVRSRDEMLNRVSPKAGFRSVSYGRAIALRGWSVRLLQVSLSDLFLEVQEDLKDDQKIGFDSAFLLTTEILRTRHRECIEWLEAHPSVGRTVFAALRGHSDRIDPDDWRKLDPALRALSVRLYRWSPSRKQLRVRVAALDTTGGRRRVLWQTTRRIGDGLESFELDSRDWGSAPMLQLLSNMPDFGRLFFSPDRIQLLDAELSQVLVKDPSASGELGSRNEGPSEALDRLARSDSAPGADTSARAARLFAERVTTHEGQHLTVEIQPAAGDQRLMRVAAGTARVVGRTRVIRGQLASPTPVVIAIATESPASRNVEWTNAEWISRLGGGGNTEPEPLSMRPLRAAPVGEGFDILASLASLFLFAGAVYFVAKTPEKRRTSTLWPTAIGAAVATSVSLLGPTVLGLDLAIPAVVVALVCAVLLARHRPDRCVVTVVLILPIPVGLFVLGSPIPAFGVLVAAVLGSPTERRDRWYTRSSPILSRRKRLRGNRLARRGGSGVA